jgi:hypothetical protein
MATRKKPTHANSESTGRAGARKLSERLAPAPGPEKSGNGSHDVRPAAHADPVPIDDGRIRERAYFMYISCGCQCGHEVEHWVEAERELKMLGGGQ